MQEFDYILAKSMEEVPTLLSSGTTNACILSGGTDLLPQLREGQKQTNLVIDIKGIHEVNEVNYQLDTGLYIGAAVSCLELTRNQDVITNYPGLIDSFSLIGGIQIQGRASVGGNLCNASPAADTIPALIVHQAECVIYGPSGYRKLPVEQFCLGPGQTILQENEFLAGLQIPPVKAGFGASYLRFIPRNEMDIAIVGVGASILAESGIISSARIGLAAVAPTPLLVLEADKPLIGLSLEDERMTDGIDKVASIAAAATRPINDLRGTVEYRRHLTNILTRRTLKIALERAKQSLGGR